MIELRGKHYARNQSEAICVLREHGEAFAGFYRPQSNGVLFFDRKRIPFSYAAMDSTNGATFFVTAGKTESGRTFYMYGLGEYTAKDLGIDGLKPSEQCAFAKDVIRQAEVPMYNRFYRDEVTA